MSRILVDTSAYSALTRGDAEILESIQVADRIFVNPIVLGELRAGFAAGNRQGKNEAALSAFLDSPRVQIALVDEDTSVFYAMIYASLRRAGTPIPSNDLWIAATAMQHGLRLLTRDAHFRRVTQVIVDCFD